MNVVVSGPFGYGSLADEAVLAGILKHLAGGEHQVCVLSADPEKTQRIHQVKSIEMKAPEHFLSNTKAWEELSTANLLLLCGAGVVSDTGKLPARVWISQLEHARRIRVKSALVGVGAFKVTVARERARLQRLLHHFVDAISTRDEPSKYALIGYGLSASRISFTGDPILALSAPDRSHPASLAVSSGQTTAVGQTLLSATGPTGMSAPPSHCAPPSHRVGIVLSCGVPSRDAFEIAALDASEPLIMAVHGLLETLCSDPAHETILFFDDTKPALKMVHECLRKLPPDRHQLQPANVPISEIQERMAGCGVIFSLSLHGLLLGAASGVPVVGLAQETGAADLLTWLGLKNYIVPQAHESFDVDAAAQSVKKVLQNSESLCEMLRKKMAILKKKEAQNGRIIELLIPRRERGTRKSTPQENEEED